MKHVFIIGAKGIGQYGGFETFVEKLIQSHENENGIQYHVACKANGEGCTDIEKLEGITDVSKKRDFVSDFRYRNAHVYRIKVPDIGPAVAIYYDVKALEYAIRWCGKKHIKEPVFYVLACRIGPFIGHFKKQIEKLGGKLFVNPDGHEWLRAKWSEPVRKYWKYSEGLMVKHADLMVCDSVNIEKYIHEEYAKYMPDTTYIAYGAEIPEESGDGSSQEISPEFSAWLEKNGTSPWEYYLAVGRCVPENNYGTMLREFMKSGTERKFILITNRNDRLIRDLDEETGFSKDERIVFAGPVYNRELLAQIRENAYAYLHGHEVGGTNPSLLEALGCTKMNLLLDVGFNREVAEDAALYWTKEEGSLSSLIDRADAMGEEERRQMGQKAKDRIVSKYSWEFIASEYRKLFLGKDAPDTQA